MLILLGWYVGALFKKHDSCIINSCIMFFVFCAIHGSFFWKGIFIQVLSRGVVCVLLKKYYKTHVTSSSIPVVFDKHNYVGVHYMRTMLYVIVAV